MKIVEVHWSDERAEVWYWNRRVRDNQSEAEALGQARDEFARQPRYRFGELVTPTLRVREVREGSSTAASPP